MPKIHKHTRMIYPVAGFDRTGAWTGAMCRCEQQHTQTPKSRIQSTNRCELELRAKHRARDMGKGSGGGGADLLLLLELARRPDPKVVGEGSGDGPRREVTPPAEPAQSVPHERPRVPHRPAPPPPRRRHLPPPLSLRHSSPTTTTTTLSLVGSRNWSARKEPAARPNSVRDLFRVGPWIGP